MQIDHSDVQPQHEDDTVMGGDVSPFGDSFPDQSHFIDEYHLYLTPQPAAAEFWSANHGINQQFGFAPSPEQYLADPSLSPYVDTISTSLSRLLTNAGIDLVFPTVK